MAVRQGQGLLGEQDVQVAEALDIVGQKAYFRERLFYRLLRLPRRSASC